MKATANGVSVEISACELYLKLLKYGRYWKTYPDSLMDDATLLTDESGEVISDEHDVPIVVEADTVAVPTAIASIDRMMEILSTELSESEKPIYVPLADYLTIHDTIRNSDVMRITGRGSTSANR